MRLYLLRENEEWWIPEGSSSVGLLGLIVSAKSLRCWCLWAVFKGQGYRRVGITTVGWHAGCSGLISPGTAASRFIQSGALHIQGLYTGPPPSDPSFYAKDGAGHAAAHLFMQAVQHMCQISHFNSQLAIHLTKGIPVYIQNIDFHFAGYICSEFMLGDFLWILLDGTYRSAHFLPRFPMLMVKKADQYGPHPWSLGSGGRD